jgi:hypothetical protein
VPQFAEKVIVFMRDMIPSVSNILKIPQRGPFQILKIKERNVTLLEPETGQTVNTHIELIRSLDLKEFRMSLNNKWDLNVHHQKAIDKRQQPGIFDEPKMADFPAPEPAAPEIQDEFDQAESNTINNKENNLSFVNSLHAYRDLSKAFKDSLQTRKEKLITFYLSKHDQYIKLPPAGEHEESEVD